MTLLLCRHYSEFYLHESILSAISLGGLNEPLNIHIEPFHYFLGHRKYRNSNIIEL
jgi:hypothetical protein